MINVSDLLTIQFLLQSFPELEINWIEVWATQCWNNGRTWVDNCYFGSALVQRIFNCSKIHNTCRTPDKVLNILTHETHCFNEIRYAGEQFTVIGERFGSTSTLLVPTTQRTTHGDRAFPVAVVWAWNALPESVRTSDSYIIFRQRLKWDYHKNAARALYKQCHMSAVTATVTTGAINVRSSLKDALNSSVFICCLNIM